MLIRNDKGTFSAGPLDLICILKDVESGRYHAAFFEDRPLPGHSTAMEDSTIVRLRSKMHHTAGAETLEEAKQHVAEMREQIEIDDLSVCEKPVAWDGQIGTVCVLPNWRTLPEISPQTNESPGFRVPF